MLRKPPDWPSVPKRRPRYAGKNPHVPVNDELSALDALLRHVPQSLKPGGRVVMLTFHSGEDRRVKKAFEAGYRGGAYSAVANEVIRATMEETRANRRASPAKLRWAVRGEARCP